MSDTDSTQPGQGTPSGGDTTPGEVTRDDIAGIFAELEKAEAPAEASAAPSPAHPDASDTSAAAPTTPPGATGVPPTPSDGGIPPDRHKAVLEKARQEYEAKGKAEAEAAFRQRYGWAERLDPAEVQNGLNAMAWLRQDPEGFVAFLQQKTQKAAPRPAPDVEAPALRSEDGQPVYSAPQLQALLQRQRDDLIQSFRQELGQVRQAVEPLRQKEAQRNLEDAATREVTNLVTNARTNWPLFTELEPHVKATLKQNPAMNLHDAYLAVFKTEGPTRFEQQFRSKQEGALADKLSATTATPGPKPSTPVRYSELDTHDLGKAVFAELEGRS